MRRILGPSAGDNGILVRYDDEIYFVDHRVNWYKDSEMVKDRQWHIIWIHEDGECAWGQSGKMNMADKVPTNAALKTPRNKWGVGFHPRNENHSFVHMQRADGKKMVCNLHGTWFYDQAVTGVGTLYEEEQLLSPVAELYQEEFEFCCTLRLYADWVHRVSKMGNKGFKQLPLPIFYTERPWRKRFFSTMELTQSYAKGGMFGNGAVVNSDILSADGTTTFVSTQSHGVWQYDNQ